MLRTVVAWLDLWPTGVGGAVDDDGDDDDVFGAPLGSRDDGRAGDPSNSVKHTGIHGDGTRSRLRGARAIRDTRPRSIRAAWAATAGRDAWRSTSTSAQSTEAHLPPGTVQPFLLTTSPDWRTQSGRVSTMRVWV